MSTDNDLVEDQYEELTTETDDDIEVVVEAEPEVEVDEAAASSEEESSAPTEAADEHIADAADPVGMNAESDPELESMPVKFRKRLEREHRLRNTIIGEREQAKAAAMQIAKIAQQQDGEMSALRQQNAMLQRQFADSLEYAYERDITLKGTEVRRAREDGNYDAELKAQGDLDALRFQQNQVRQVRTTLPNPDTVARPQQQPQQQRPQQQQQQQQQQPPAPLAVRWVANNKAWLNSPKFASHRAFTLEEDRRLANEGYDKNSAEYYTELDRRLDSAFPTLRKQGRGTGSVVAPAGSVPASKSSRTVTITRADLSNMQRFGLDPSNKEHLREYARNKRATT